MCLLVRRKETSHDGAVNHGLWHILLLGVTAETMVTLAFFSILVHDTYIRKLALFHE